MKFHGPFAFSFFVSASLSLLGQSALAEPLSREVKIAVEEPDEDGRACGVTAIPIADRASFVLRSANWKVSDESLHTLYLNPTVIKLRDTDMCVYSLSVQLLRPLLTVEGNTIIAITVIKGSTGIVRRENASRKIIEIIEEAAKEAIGSAEANGR